MTLLLILLALLKPEVPERTRWICDCQPISLEAAIEDADFIFSGRVLGVNQTAAEDNDTRAPAMLLVEREFKGGELPTAVIVSSRMSEVQCGYRFEVDGRYLVYAYGHTDDSGITSLGTTLCHRSRLADEVDQEEWDRLWERLSTPSYHLGRL